MATQKPIIRKKNNTRANIKRNNLEFNKVCSLVQKLIKKLKKEYMDEIETDRNGHTIETEELVIKFSKKFKGISIFHKRMDQYILMLSGQDSPDKAKHVLTSITSQTSKSNLIGFYKPSVGKVSNSSPKEVYQKAMKMLSFYNLDLPKYD